MGASLQQNLRSCGSCSKILTQGRNGIRWAKICQRDSLTVIMLLFALSSLCCSSKSLQAIWSTSDLYSGDVKNLDLSCFLLWPMDPKILDPKQPNVSSHKKASCQMLEQLMAQMTEVAICFGQLSFRQPVPRRTSGRRQMAPGGCSGCPSATGSWQGLGRCSRFPQRYWPGKEGFKSEPSKPI